MSRAQPPVPAPPPSPPTQTLLPQLPPRGNPFPHDLTAAQLLGLPHVSILLSAQPAPPGAPSNLNPFRWGLPEWATGLAPACLRATSPTSHRLEEGRGGEGGETGQGTSSPDPREAGRSLTSWRAARLRKSHHGVAQACNTPSEFRTKAILSSRVRPSGPRRGQEEETANLSAEGGQSICLKVPGLELGYGTLHLHGEWGKRQGACTCNRSTRKLGWRVATRS